MRPAKSEYVFSTFMDAFASFVALKATSQLTIFMRGMRTTGKIQRNNYQDIQCRPSFAGKTSSVPLIAQTHAQRMRSSLQGVEQCDSIFPVYRYILTISSGAKHLFLRSYENIIFASERKSMLGMPVQAIQLRP